MASCRIRQAIGTVKDHTSIGLAKISGTSSISDLQVAIVKATRHGENPPNPCYAEEILSLTSYSRAMVQACVSTIAKRLNRTKNWVVALKSLMLVQRLLAKGGSAFENDFFFNTRRGTRFLNMCDFRDTSSKNGWDYSAFVRAYASYLDEALEFKLATKDGDCYEEEDVGVVRHTPPAEMENEAIFLRADDLMQLFERFLACRPVGAAKHNRVVVVAIYPILKESFQIHHCTTEILGALIDRFMQMDVPDMIQVHDIFCRVSKQYDELYCFYNWCKTVGIMRFPDYPTVEKISHSKLHMMEDFIRQKSATLHIRKASFSPKLTPGNLSNRTEPDKEEKYVQEKKKTLEEGDLLNLDVDEPNTKDVVDTMALTLLGSYPDHSSTIPPLKDSTSRDWETTLVQSESHLSKKKPSLPQGFDTVIVDGMYQQGTMTAATSGFMANGSASSIIVTPAPPTVAAYDPFAASLAVSPPAYVQISELEKKQNLLLQEQLLWQQYLRDGMHGQVALEKLQQQNFYHPKAW